MMKIGVNARWLTKPYTGIGQYTKNLFENLAKIDVKNKYILVVPEKIRKEIEESFPKNVKIKVLPERRIGTAGMRKTWWEQISVPEFLQKEKVDIAFFTYAANPWNKDWYKLGIKTVVTVHDCIPWLDKAYQRRLLSRMYHHQTKKAVELADIVLTVSKDAAADIKELSGAKSIVVPNDADEIYKKKINLKRKIEILKKFNLKEKDFFLYVGGYDPRKNVDFLIEEFKKFGKKKLVLAGGKVVNSSDYKSFDLTEKNIIKTGFLSEEELAILYFSCLAFINLSKKEGFNIPLIEAANCGAPIILSDIKVHREVAGDNVMFVKLKQNEAKKALEKMLNDKARNEFAQKSAKLAKKYSWEKSAKKVKDVLFS